jgi:hypothetical protein
MLQAHEVWMHMLACLVVLQGADDKMQEMPAWPGNGCPAKCSTPALPPWQLEPKHVGLCTCDNCVLAFCLQRGHFSITEDDILQAAADVAAAAKSAGSSASVSAISLDSVGDALEVSCEGSKTVLLKHRPI